MMIFGKDCWASCYIELLFRWINAYFLHFMKDFTFHFAANFSTTIFNHFGHSTVDCFASWNAKALVIKWDSFLASSSFRLCFLFARFRPRGLATFETMKLDLIMPCFGLIIYLCFWLELFCLFTS